MLKKICGIGLFVLWAVIVIAGGRPAQAQSSASLTITVKSAYARVLPSLGAARSYSVFKGQTYIILEKDRSAAWVRLAYVGATQPAWVAVANGAVTGDLGAIPTAQEAATGATPAATGPAAGATSTPANVGATSTPANVGAAVPTGVKFTITVKSAYARSDPSWSGTKLTSAFKGQVFAAVARDNTSAWVQVVLGDGSLGWFSVGSGQLSAAMAALPTSDGVTIPTTNPVITAVSATPPPSFPPAWLPVITPKMKQIYQQSIKRGRNLNAVAIASDCNFEEPYYQPIVAGGTRHLPGYEFLQPTVDRFYASFMRQSIASNGGFRASSMFDPLWVDPKVCRAGEGPLACELRITKASVVFIGLGTGDQFQWEQFEANYRKIVEYVLSHGALPVLMTKGDNLEYEEGGAATDYINQVIRRLGTEYDVPVFDFAVGAKTLPNNGLRDEPGHLFHLNADGIGLRTMGVLEVLYLLTQP
jgi:hypothetical protein